LTSVPIPKLARAHVSHEANFEITTPAMQNARPFVGVWDCNRKTTLRLTMNVGKPFPPLS